MACVDFNDLDPPDQDTAELLNRMILEMAGLLAFLEHSEFHVVHAWEAVGENVLRRRGRTGSAVEGVDSYVREMRVSTAIGSTDCCANHPDGSFSPGTSDSMVAFGRRLYDPTPDIRAEGPEGPTRVDSRHSLKLLRAAPQGQVPTQNRHSRSMARTSAIRSQSGRPIAAIS